jgi:hypothetical protein
LPIFSISAMTRSIADDGAAWFITMIKLWLLIDP